MVVSGGAAPTIDPTNGTFSGPSLPGNAMTLAFAGELASNVVGSSGSLRSRLISLQMGQIDLSGCCANGQAGIPAQYVFRVFTATDSFDYTYAIQQGFNFQAQDNRNFAVLNLDNDLAVGYGGDSSFQIYGQQIMRVPLSAAVGDWGTGPALAGSTLGRYNGDRWFAGPSPANNETTADPTSAGNCGSGAGACSSAQAGAITSFNNAGALPGVETVYEPRGYITFDREWRNVGSSLASAYRGADFNVYWGAAGVVDSVIDATHNVVVPFESTNVGAGWGILNNAAAGLGGADGRPDDTSPAVLTALDWTCVEPLRSTLSQPANGFFPCTSGSAVYPQQHGGTWSDRLQRWSAGRDRRRQECAEPGEHPAEQRLLDLHRRYHQHVRNDRWCGPGGWNGLDAADLRRPDQWRQGWPAG